MNPIDRNILPLEELKEYRLYRKGEVKIFRIGVETFYSILEKHEHTKGDFWKINFESRGHAQRFWGECCRKGWKMKKKC